MVETYLLVIITSTNIAMIIQEIAGDPDFDIWGQIRRDTSEAIEKMAMMAYASKIDHMTP